VFPVRYELGFYISEDGILHSHRREKPQILHKGYCLGDDGRNLVPPERSVV
jgi:hypothetical protein